MGTFAKMKPFVFIAFFCLSIITITESCIVVTCTVAQATCTAPCFQCGTCKQYCCKNVFLGRNEDERTLQTYCAPGEGRESDSHENEEYQKIELLEKKSFEICDENEDGGLSWAEVETCEETYGLFVNLDRLPNKEDFDYFDSDQNGILYFEEWETISH